MNDDIETKIQNIENNINYLMVTTMNIEEVVQELKEEIKKLIKEIKTTKK
jgi:peptidoglycan hydrolase CwlO-like protein